MDVKKILVTALAVIVALVAYDLVIKKMVMKGEVSEYDPDGFDSYEPVMYVSSKVA